MAEQIVELAPDESKEISFEAVPAKAKTYSVSVDGLSGSFSALPAIPPATVLAGAIIDTKWRETGTEEWHPWPMSIPGNTGIDVLWRVRNNSNGRATFAISTGTPERFFTIHSDNVATLDPGGEADLIHEGYSGEKAGTSGTQTWDLIALAGEVTSSYVLDWLEAVFVDSVTLHYSWY